jgi:hypothetical protein
MTEIKRTELRMSFQHQVHSISLMIVQSTAHPFADCGWQNTSSLGATILSSASRKQMHRTLDANAAKNLGE